MRIVVIQKICVRKTTLFDFEHQALACEMWWNFVSFTLTFSMLSFKWCAWVQKYVAHALSQSVILCKGIHNNARIIDSLCEKKFAQRQAARRVLVYVSSGLAYVLYLDEAFTIILNLPFRSFIKITTAHYNLIR